jgi:cytochrome c6
MQFANQTGTKRENRMMRDLKAGVFVLFAALVAMLALPAARAQSAESIYKAKCAGCHAADGTGSMIGKKLGAHDFHSADVQKQSDADLSAVIAKGRNKMPAYEKTLKADDIKGLVAYVRSLGK